MSILSVGIVILNARHEVLLVKHGPKAQHLTGIYGLPAGKVENHESLIDAACRELYEETGVTIKPHALAKLPEVYYAEIKQKNGTKAFDWHVFYGQLTSETTLKSTLETEPIWVNLETLSTLPLLPNVEKAVVKAVEIASR